MNGYIIIPDRLMNYLSSSIEELANVFAEVSGLTVVSVSAAGRQIKHCDMLLAMGFPSRVFDGKLLDQIRFKKLILWLDDLGWECEERYEEIFSALNRSDLIITPNPTKFRLLWPQYAHKLKWLPLHASQEFLNFKFNHQATQKCLLSGFISEKYPLRQAALQLAQHNSPLIDVLPHPGYSEFSPWIREAYAEILHRYCCCLTDGHSTWIDFQGQPAQDYLRRSGFEKQAKATGQVVKKFFEIPAVGSLLVADNPAPQEMHKLGFVAGKNYLQVTVTNLAEQVAACLESRQKWEELRMAGMKLIHEKHTIQQRWHQFRKIWNSFLIDVKQGLR